MMERSSSMIRAKYMDGSCVRAHLRSHEYSTNSYCRQNSQSITSRWFYHRSSGWKPCAVKAPKEPSHLRHGRQAQSRPHKKGSVRHSQTSATHHRRIPKITSLDGLAFPVRIGGLIHPLAHLTVFG